MPRDLLLEIGTEEIPAGFLAGVLPVLEERAGELLAAARLDHGDVRVLGAPRRLALLVADVADSQASIREHVVGPPARVAFDADGAPTKAAVGFAARNGVDVSALARGEVEGKKGEYVTCVRHEPGRVAVEVLPGEIEALIQGLPWPKSMRWSNLEQAFVRPVHWLVCLFGDEILPVQFAGIQAGADSHGHRFLKPGAVPLAGSLRSYERLLREAFVIVDPGARRTMIEAELRRIESETGLVVRGDPELVGEVANLVEYPVGVCGEFSVDFLEVPEEVLVSAMRSHQRYFAMEDSQGALANRFVTIAGTVAHSADIVRRGNERVLAARLADAKFFFEEDRAIPLAQWADKLNGVVFQSKLGSVGAKVARVVTLSSALATELGQDAAMAARAAKLCKADLVTHMVGEFPDLQGIMGGHYARHAGEPEPVCAAIPDHYLPRGAGDELPASDLGTVVGIADRIDTIVGCFAVGLAPTGSADPYGLRRAALGILRLLVGRTWSFDLNGLIERAVQELRSVVEPPASLAADVAEFFRVRFRGLLADIMKLPVDCVDAALAVGFADPRDTRNRAEAMARLRDRPDFDSLAVAFKRVANILKDQDRDQAGSPDPGAFVEDDERALWVAFTEVRQRVDRCLDGSDYNGALQVLTELKAPVDRFFDSVLVMDKDESVRTNRLAMLGRINDTFNRIADFRQLAV